MNVRLIVGLLATALFCAVSVRPCAALRADLMAPAGGAHDCCDHTQQPPTETPADCELSCAKGTLPFSAPPSAFALDSSAGVGLPVSSADPTPPLPPRAHRQQHVQPPRHAPPLFVLHAALLI